MTVYVDDMLRPARVGRIRSRWSHLMADTHDELMAFALQIGMRPEWLQEPGSYREHFDLTTGRRDQALALGAEPISYPHGTAAVMAAKRRNDPTVRMAGRVAALLALVIEPYLEEIL
ncbi:MAG: DUF4031 domain-containing protein [Streptomycetaceae bacterium]|nr:DUF4031 domain-containing protein [Streptomycetaceae bacterium]